jgi:putative component of toxin-antitoxin plasmid stabilization module
VKGSITARKLHNRARIAGRLGNCPIVEAGEEKGCRDKPQEIRIHRSPHVWFLSSQSLGQKLNSRLAILVLFNRR